MYFTRVLAVHMINLLQSIALFCLHMTRFYVLSNILTAVPGASRSSGMRTSADRTSGMMTMSDGMSGMRGTSGRI